MTLAGMVVGTQIRPSTPEENKRITNFFDRLSRERPPEELLEKAAGLPEETPARDSMSSPLALIGVCVSAIGLILLFSVILTSIIQQQVTINQVQISIFAGLALIGLGVVFYLLNPGEKPPAEKDEKQNDSTES
jgi:hypothetical protein